MTRETLRRALAGAHFRRSDWILRCGGTSPYPINNKALRVEWVRDRRRYAALARATGDRKHRSVFLVAP